MRLTRTTAPAATLISAAEAKDYCRVKSDHEDALFGRLVGAATNLLDGPGGILGRAMVTQTWSVELPAWPELRFVVPVEPVQSLTIGYHDAAGEVQTLPVGAYEIVTSPKARAEIVWTRAFAAPLLDADRIYPVAITVTAGHAADHPDLDPLRIAMLELVAHWWTNRSAVVTGAITAEVPWKVDALLAPYRRHL